MIQIPSQSLERFASRRLSDCRRQSLERFASRRLSDCRRQSLERFAVAKQRRRTPVREGVERAIALTLIDAGFNWIGEDEELDSEEIFRLNNCQVMRIEGGIVVIINEDMFTLPTQSDFWCEEDIEYVSEKKAIALAEKAINEAVQQFNSIPGQLSLF